MDTDVVQIVDGCRRRDAKAQRALYDAMAPMVGGVCARYSRDHDESQDMVQDVFVKIFERIGTLKQTDNLRSWVYSTAVNTAIDHCRRRVRVLSMDVIDMDVPAVETDPYMMEAILAAMRRLTPMLRTVFNMCDIEGYTLDEAAERLGSNNQAVRTALCRARREIRKELEMRN